MYMHGLQDIGPHDNVSYTGQANPGVFESDFPVTSSTGAITAGSDTFAPSVNFAPRGPLGLPATILGMPTKNVLIGALILTVLYVLLNKKR